jgi:hypothetical protein
LQRKYCEIAASIRTEIVSDFEGIVANPDRTAFFAEVSSRASFPLATYGIRVHRWHWRLLYLAGGFQPYTVYLPVAWQCARWQGQQ